MVVGFGVVVAGAGLEVVVVVAGHLVTRLDQLLADLLHLVLLP